MIKNIKNVFKTKEEAEEYREYIKAKKEYSTEFTQEEWEDEGLEKCSLYYDYDYKELMYDCSYTYRKMNVVYFIKENIIKFKEKYEKQILKYEFEIEEE